MYEVVDQSRVPLVDALSIDILNAITIDSSAVFFVLADPMDYGFRI